MSRVTPSYIIIGAQRAGTTSLYDYITRHPNAPPASVKEVHYFDNNFANGPDWYARQLDNRRMQLPGRRRVFGEASPYYLFHPAVPARIRGAAPDVKLIAMLRDPVARAYSHYQWSVGKGHETLPFEAALEAENERLAGEEERLLADPDYSSPAHRNFSYVARGMYAAQLNRWFVRFPREQMLVVSSEDLFADPARVVAEVEAFIGLDPHPLDNYEQHNASAYPSDMSQAARERLQQTFRAPNAELTELLGRGFGWP